VVFPDGTGVNPGTKLVKAPSYPGIADDYRRTIRLLESLKPDIFLSFHSEFFDLEGKCARVAPQGVRAWLDPEGYRRRIAAEKAVFEKLVSHEKQAR